MHYEQRFRQLEGGRLIGGLPSFNMRKPVNSRREIKDELGVINNVDAHSVLQFVFEEVEAGEQENAADEANTERRRRQLAATMKIPEEKVGELVVAIKGLTHPVSKTIQIYFIFVRKYFFFLS